MDTGWDQNILGSVGNDLIFSEDKEPCPRHFIWLLMFRGLFRGHFVASKFLNLIGYQYHVFLYFLFWLYNATKNHICLKT